MFRVKTLILNFIVSDERTVGTDVLVSGKLMSDIISYLKKNV